MPEARQLAIVHEVDPGETIWRGVGPLDGVEVLNQQVLVGLYVRPSEVKTTGGILVPDKVVDEDLYQSKVGLALKLGPRAFKDEEAGAYPLLFHGFTVNPGDWVVFRMSDGIAMQIGKIKCRLIPDVHLKMRISHPDAIF